MQALRRISERERQGGPAASQLSDIFEGKEDTEMIIFKKPAKETTTGSRGNDGMKTSGPEVSRSDSQGRRGSGMVDYPNKPPLPVIPVPIQILDEMPIPYVHMLFATLK